jgi:hypothetical protein
VALGNASALKSSGIAPFTPFGLALTSAVASVDTSHVDIPTTPEKLFLWAFVIDTRTVA